MGAFSVKIRTAKREEHRGAWYRSLLCSRCIMYGASCTTSVSLRSIPNPVPPSNPGVFVNLLGSRDYPAHPR